jgi:hypothetical protein
MVEGRRKPCHSKKQTIQQEKLNVKVMEALLLRISWASVFCDPGPQQVLFPIGS